MSTSFNTSNDSYSSKQSDSDDQFDNTVSTNSNDQGDSYEKSSYDQPDISDRSGVVVSWDDLYYGGTTVDDALF